jgi:hypothetical protein
MLTRLHEEILALRKAMWEKVDSRSHNPIKIFPFGSYSDEVSRSCTKCDYRDTDFDSPPL